ncbi:hypothetical protein PENTCL1PPCAC_2519 [Pristionchus entomophagus]|uniref:Cytochrome P450 n=1 Tax=Pristionchus entomophagus TaxID=358040 RepID=A0AAV5SC02_9BILA|nr:hypothetical protein PENTCL1PPCAC_2519 [Pristionchus entomophagus]
MAILLAFLLCIIFIILDNRRKITDFITYYSKARKAFSKIPGPPSIPLFGSAHLFKWNVMKFSYQVEEWGRKYLLADPEKSHGMWHLWAGPVPVIVCGTHESIRVILESNSNITKPHHYQILEKWLGTGLVIRTNNDWHARRKLLTPAFHFNILRRYIPIFGEQTQILLNIFDEHADTNEIVDVFPLIKRCGLDIIAETAMGTRLGSQTHHNSQYIDAVYRLSQIAWDHIRFPWLWLKPIWNISGYANEFNSKCEIAQNFTRKVIEQRREALEEEGLLDGEVTEEQVKTKKLALLDLLLMMQKANALSDEELRAEVDTFMFEGSDTNASAIGFTLWFLGQHPEYQEKVHEEIDEIFGSDNRHPTEEDICRMVYIEKCYKEALRMTPPVPIIARQLSHDTPIGDVVLPEGMTVIVSPVSASRDARYWERPEEFYPNHFDSDKQAARDSYSFIPFSGGPRNCIGQKFAVLEAKSMLAQIFRRFRIESIDIWPANRPLPEIILKPSNGFKVQLYRR